MNNEKIIDLISNGRKLKNEELWSLGYGITLNNKIEVSSKNIARFNEYKCAKLESIFGKKEIGTLSWRSLPIDQVMQVKEVMNLIRKSIISLKLGLTVCNISNTTLRFLYDLGYGVSGNFEGAWISWKNVREKVVSKEYISADLAHNLTILLNEFLLLNFLYYENEQKKEFVIIRNKDVIVDKCDFLFNVYEFFKSLNLEFNSESFIEAYGAEKLIFIKLDFGSFKLCERKKYLEQCLRLN